MIPDPNYWQAVADGIDAENQKATIFLKHKLSIGAAREAILRDLLIKQTPEPYRISSGFIYQYYQGRSWSSKQCDVLIYDPTISQPYYAISGLSVLPTTAAKLVIEVKTKLDQKSYGDITRVWKTTSLCYIPTLGFAYEGVAFESFLAYIQDAIKGTNHEIPECVAVHEQNYLFVRSERHRFHPPNLAPYYRRAKHYFAVNFGDGKSKTDGRASAAFLEFSHRLLTCNHLQENILAKWFNELSMPKNAMVKIGDDGTVTRGKL